LTGTHFIQSMSPRVSPSSIFVVIPVYNEGSVIRSVVDKLVQHNYSIVIVDDGSAQNPFPFVSDAPIYFLRHPVNLGQGAALQTGIEFALAEGAEYIVTFDGDGQHEASDIGKFIDVLAAGKADIVLGSRFMADAAHNMTRRRQATLQIARYINYLFTGLLHSDAHNGLRAMNRRTAEGIRIHENRMAHATEILAQIKHKRLRYTELPVQVYYTDYSRAKGQTVWSSFRILFDLLLAKLFG
jgi:polyprenyl-phospho-N-acetylgalactosaminyl synthase